MYPPGCVAPRDVLKRLEEVLVSPGRNAREHGPTRDVLKRAEEVLVSPGRNAREHGPASGSLVGKQTAEN